MRSMLLVAAVLVAPSAIASESKPDMELAVRATATRLVAFNPTDRSHFVFLTDSVSGARATLIVPAQSWIESSFAESVVANLDLTVATRTDTGVVFSEKWRYRDLVLASPDFVWFDYDEHAHAWASGANGLEPLEPTGTTNPTAHALCVPPAHISVATPCNVPRADLPPIFPVTTNNPY